MNLKPLSFFSHHFHRPEWGRCSRYLHAVRGRLSPVLGIYIAIYICRDTTLNGKNPVSCLTSLIDPYGEVAMNQRGENHSVYDPGKGGGICVYILYNALLCIVIMYLLYRLIGNNE